VLISRTAVHGIYAICYLNRQRSSEVSSSATVAASLGITRAHAAKVLKRLAAAGVVTSVRGRRGGYTLTRKMSQIPVLEVLDALQPVQSKTHLRAAPCRNETAPLCSAHRGLLRLEDRMRNALAQETLEGLEGSVCTTAADVVGDRSECRSKGICERLVVPYDASGRIVRKRSDEKHTKPGPALKHV